MLEMRSAIEADFWIRPNLELISNVPSHETGVSAKPPKYKYRYEDSHENAGIMGMACVRTKVWIIQAETNARVFKPTKAPYDESGKPNRSQDQIHTPHEALARSITTKPKLEARNCHHDAAHKKADVREGTRSAVVAWGAHEGSPHRPTEEYYDKSVCHQQNVRYQRITRMQTKMGIQRIRQDRSDKHMLVGYRNQKTDEEKMIWVQRNNKLPTPPLNHHTLF